MLSSKSFIESSLTFRPLIHFEFPVCWSPLMDRNLVVRTRQKESERELEGGREREKERKKDTGTQALMEQGYFISRNAGLCIFSRWLLSYYTGWNFINSHNMDSLTHTRLLTQERVTEGSYWKESKQIPFLMRSVLRVVCSSTHSQNRNL